MTEKPVAILSKKSDDIEGDLKYGSALLVALVGLTLPALLAGYLGRNSVWTPADVIALIGAFTTVVGTLVGAFLGVQVGSAGKSKAEHLSSKALAALDPSVAAKVLADSE